MIPFPSKKYQIIYADPPWKFKYYGKSDDKYRRAEGHYEVMNIGDIKKIPIQSITNDNCALFMWAIYPMLPHALELIKAWKFQFKTVAFTWIKKNRTNSDFFFGMGYWTRANPEICLLATKGNPKRVDCNVANLIISPRQAHSEKPSEVRNRIIELMGDLPRIELFARPPKDLLFEDESYKGWDLWGNEV